MKNIYLCGAQKLPRQMHIIHKCNTVHIPLSVIHVRYKHTTSRPAKTKPLISSCRLLLLTLEKKAEAVDGKERQRQKERKNRN